MLGSSPATVSVEREALVVAEERVTPVSLKSEEEASRRYPSAEAETGESGKAAQFAVMDELKIPRKTGETVEAGFANVEVPPLTAKLSVSIRLSEDTRK